MQKTEFDGRFMRMMARSNDEIKGTRQVKIARDFYRQYCARIQELKDQIQDLTDSLEDMLDMSPSTTIGLELASKFDAAAFMKNRESLVIQRLNKQDRLDEIQADFNSLFDDTTVSAEDTEAETEEAPVEAGV